LNLKLNFRESSILWERHIALTQGWLMHTQEAANP
jgi:hypothetical protein